MSLTYTEFFKVYERLEEEALKLVHAFHLPSFIVDKKVVFDERKVIVYIYDNDGDNRGNIEFRIHNDTLKFTDVKMEFDFFTDSVGDKSWQQKTGIYASRISEVCHGKKTQAGGFIWKFEVNMPR